MENKAAEIGSSIIVDSHAHVFTTEMPLCDNPRHSPDYDFTVEDYIEVLDKHNVGLAVLAAASPWLDYNDYLIDCVRRTPRLRGTVILEPSVDRYIMEKMKHDGIVGVRMHLIGLKKMPDITSFEYRRMFKRIADLDWHIHLHVEGRDIPDILPFFENTGAKIVLDHLGRPDHEEGINSEGFTTMVRSIERGRTWVKASGHHRIGSSSDLYLSELINRVGSNRLVWGSDCPFVGEEAVTYQSTIDWLLKVVKDPVDRSNILGRNALELYFSGS